MSPRVGFRVHESLPSYRSRWANTILPFHNGYVVLCVNIIYYAFLAG